MGLALLLVSLVLGDIFDGLLDALSGDAFSIAVLGGFVSALGVGGALAQALGAPLVLAVPAGVVAGMGLCRLAHASPGRQRHLPGLRLNRAGRALAFHLPTGRFRPLPISDTIGT